MRGHPSIRARSATETSRGRPATRTGSKPTKIIGLPTDPFSSHTLATRCFLFFHPSSDHSTHFHTRNARWYDPLVGRFVGRAKYRPDEEQPYGICAGNPVSLSDPTGQNALPNKLCTDKEESRDWIERVLPAVGRGNLINNNEEITACGNRVTNIALEIKNQIPVVLNSQKFQEVWFRSHSRLFTPLQCFAPKQHGDILTGI
jgi:RHS repeat-associated protein